MSIDTAAIEHLVASGADLTVPHTVQHFIYMPSKEAAASVARELRRRGYQTVERLGADGVNWLVLATHEMLVSDELVTSTRQAMQTLIAQSGGGEYDGWEAEVRQARPN